MLIVDIETSGVDARAASILSIGAVDFFNPKNKFYQECKAFDGAQIIDESLAVNGFTREQALDETKSSCKEIVENFFKWASTAKCTTLAGHMTQFDEAFLKQSAEKFDIAYPFGKRLIDLHSIAYFHMMKRGIEPPLKNGQSNLSSDFVMDYVGLPREPRPHIAINGAVWEAEALNRLINAKALFEEFEKYPVPEYFKR